MEPFSSTMTIISCITILIQQACNPSLAIGQCIVTRKRMHQLVAGQVLYRHDLLCSQVRQASHSTPFSDEGRGSRRFSNWSELQVVSDRA